MKMNILAALVLASLMLISGCTTTRGSSSSANLQREVDSLKTEVAALRDANRLSDMRGGSADSYNEINRLRTDFQRLSDNVSSLNSRMDRVEQQAGLNTGSSAPASGNQARTSTPPANSTGPVSSTSSAPLPPTATAAAPAGPYEDGKNLYDKKDYRAAITQFKSYLAAEPKGSNADSAQYYIGESLFAEKQYEEAILEYQKVVQGFPKSTQVPNSLLKQGRSFESIGDKDSAKLLYQKLIRDFPKNWAAEVAKTRLSGL